MTYDERQEIEEWLDIVSKSCENTLTAVKLVKKRLELLHCEDECPTMSASDIKNDFLKQF